MKLTSLHEEDDLRNLGRLIAHLSSDDKVATYNDLSPDFGKFLVWLRRLDPEKWDDSVSKSIARFAKSLFGIAQKKGDRAAAADARKWSQISTMPGTTIVPAITSAPDSEAGPSAIDDPDMPDDITNPVREKLGDSAYSAIVSALSKNQSMLDRVLRIIYQNLGSLTPK